MDKKDRIVIVGDDGRCTCSCAHTCPRGKAGIATRCTLEELIKDGIPYIRERDLSIDYHALVQSLSNRILALLATEVVVWHNNQKIDPLGTLQAILHAHAGDANAMDRDHEFLKEEILIEIACRFVALSESHMDALKILVEVRQTIEILGIGFDNLLAKVQK